jgi:hypothetical protein
MHGRPSNITLVSECSRSITFYYSWEHWRSLITKARESGTHVQAAFIAASGVIVALAFFILDFRNEAFVNHARVALQSMEKLPPFLLLPDCKLATKGGERSFCKSHAFWLRAIELCLLALSLFALISLIPNGCYVRSH